jgi:hypothetical protein
LHFVGAKKVGEVEFGRCALLHAHGCAIELERGIYLKRLAHHEALAVIIIDADEVEAERGVSRRRPRRVTRKNINLSGLQRCEAILGR